MLRDILRDLEPKMRKELYLNKLVCGCVYRSFSDVEANLFFRLTSNDGKMTKQDLLEVAVRSPDNSVFLRMKEIFVSFAKLDIILNSPKQIQMDSFELVLNRTFAQNLHEYLLTNQIVQPVDIDAPPQSEPQPYQFLELLFNGQLPKNCSIEGMSDFARFPSSDQFNYIKSDISWKIGLLINGIICSSNRIKNIEHIVFLNLLDSNSYYRRTPELDSLLIELHRINLVQFAGPSNSCFRISKYLKHFTFAKANKKVVNTKLNCRIIIETNFKVFVILQPNNQNENRVLRQILSKLVRMENSGAEYEELLIGAIEKKFMKEFFQATNIPPDDYFEFFKQYMDEDCKKEEDLGKWSKLKFLGLDGPSEDGVIPSNIRQEVRLWNKFRADSDED